jgi:membrane-bound serine protease (ClpP class)
MNSRFAVLSSCVFLIAAAARSNAEQAGVITIHGAIGPATAGYVARAIMVSENRGDECLIIELDTPGGLLDSTKEIVQSFYRSRVPTVVYVAPSGASAGSAGCFITLAADIAAMAPNTTIGAAHPVSLGIGGAEKQDDVMKTKLENFEASNIQAIAERHGRNAEWAKSAVRESASITAEQALATNVIDLIATDVTDLMKKLDGRKVGNRRLHTVAAKLAAIPMASREKVFQVLWRPEIMFILMLAAIYGLIGELSSPGAILPGVVGAIAFLMVLYLSSVLPVNLAGVALIVLSIILFVIDVFAPTHGVLTGGGILAFFLGALMLFNRADPSFRLSLAWIVPATCVTAAFFIFVVGAGLRAQRLPVKSGKEAMIGKTVSAVGAIDAHQGKVFVEGEYWNATSDSPVAAGQIVEIIGVEGLSLKVKPKAA